VSRPLRIGTRGSPLALAQAEAVARLLPGPWELVTVTTAGDRGGAGGAPPGSGVFVTALEEALRGGEVDLCVHSAKDVPPETPDDLVLVAYAPRGDPRDAVVGRPLAELAAGAAVGTGSPRRAAQLRALRPDLSVRPLAGNVDTRLRRVAAGEFDAAVLARAGLERLGRSAEVRQVLEPEEMVPAAGQGALVLQARRGDASAAAAASLVADAATAFCVGVERAVQAALDGGCASPCGVLCRSARQGRGWEVLAALVGGDGAVIRVAASVPGIAGTPGLGERLAAAALHALGAARAPGRGPGAGGAVG
jgi:hydroxymethylbilane synthase